MEKNEEPPGQAALQGWRYALVGMGMEYNALSNPKCIFISLRPKEQPHVQRPHLLPVQGRCR